MLCYGSVLTDLSYFLEIRSEAFLDGGLVSHMNVNLP